MTRIRDFRSLLGDKIGFLSRNEAQAYRNLNFIIGLFISPHYSNHRKIINLDEDTNLKNHIYHQCVAIILFNVG